MKREILFRAKTFKNQWVNGDLIQYPSSTQIGRLNFADEISFVKVKKETVCQFTGLHDKNGTKIFEGDILKTNEASWVGKVEFKHFSYIITDDKGGYSTYPDFVKCEVIGNMHDKPEMLVS